MFFMEGVDIVSGGLTGIVDSILNEAKVESARILADAQRRKEAILADAGLRAEKVKSDSLVSVSNLEESFVSKENSLAEMKYRDGVLKAKLGIVNDVIESAKDFLHDLPVESYFSILLKVCSGCFYSGRECSLILPREDCDKMTDVFKEMFVSEAKKRGTDLSICVDGDEKKFRGAILKYCDYEENCSLDEIFCENEDDILVFLLDFLFEEDAGSPAA